MKSKSLVISIISVIFAASALIFYFFNLRSEIKNANIGLAKLESRVNTVEAKMDSLKENIIQLTDLNTIKTDNSIKPKNIISKNTLKDSETVEIYYCDKSGCPGHSSPNAHCAYYCDKPGCPGHSSPGDHCAYYCDKPDCPGHSSPDDRCQ